MRRLRYACLLSAMCLLGLPTATAGVQSPGNGRIAWAHFQDGNLSWDIYTMEPDGSDRTDLSKPVPTLDRQPAWSPDGTKIAWEMEDEQIWVMNVDGSNPTRITFGPWAHRSPSWSPDGSQIAFVSDRFDDGSDFDIGIMDSDGANLHRVLDTPQQETAVDWAPDGQTLAFSGSTPELSDPSLRITDVVGSEVATITNIVDGAEEPDWSPDGSKILFNQGGIDWDLFVVNADGSSLDQIADRGQDGAWSPNGRRIVYSSGEGSLLEGDDREVVVIQADGSNPRILTNNSVEDDEPHWALACTGGTEADDTIEGTPGDDFLCGRGGDDLIDGAGGSDTVLAGRGSDQVIGGPGQDVLNGGTGVDRLFGGYSNDVLNAVDRIRENDEADGGGGTDLCLADRRDSVTRCETISRPGPLHASRW